MIFKMEIRSPSSCLRMSLAWIAILWGVYLFLSVNVNAQQWPIKERETLLLGVGDRLDWFGRGARRVTSSTAESLGQPTDLLSIWLPRGWTASWLPQQRLQQLVEQGTVPVVLHYYFEDRISQQAIERNRKGWHKSLAAMGRLVRNVDPVLIVLEPEFNDLPPKGETQALLWPGLVQELSEAIDIVRAQAPHAMISIGAGDFSPARDLDPVIWKLVHKLDFLAFQEMRAQTDPDFTGPDYFKVGEAAVEYAAYLKQFDLPILLAYVALSSYSDWEQNQADMLAQLQQQEANLRAQGVFGLTYFQLFDDPKHTGYFGAAERNFGLYTHTGVAKPAAEVLKRWAHTK
jgi:hypothetical protein